MGLRYEFKKAAQTIDTLSPEDLGALSLICEDIRQAETALNQHAGLLLQKCIASCAGICCRNIRLDEVIGFYDFVYLLTVKNDMRDEIAARLRNESLFSSNCVFLKNGNGPCMFPDDARPRICIITFCAEDTPVTSQVQEVNRRFDDLADFLLSRRLNSVTKYIGRLFFKKANAD